MNIFQAYYNSLDFRDKKALRSLLVEQCGISKQTVWAWVRGSRFPKKSTRKVIADVIEIDCCKLFPGIKNLVDKR